MIEDIMDGVLAEKGVGEEGICADCSGRPAELENECCSAQRIWAHGCYDEEDLNVSSNFIAETYTYLFRSRHRVRHHVHPDWSRPRLTDTSLRWLSQAVFYALAASRRGL